MRPMFKETAFLLEQLRQVFMLIIIQTAGERQMMRSLHDIDRVELHKAHRFDHRLEKRRGGLASRIGEQPLRSKEQSAC